jgi:predicted kinase
MRPSVIALTGLPGTGKTRIGAALYPMLPPDFAYLDIDTLTQPLVRAALDVVGLCVARAAANGTLRRLRDAQYACLWNQVRELVSLRRSVLVVAPMTHELDDPQAFFGVVASLQPARFVLMRAHAPPETVRVRLEQRGDFLDEYRLSRWELDLQRYLHPAPLPMNGFELDTTGPSAQHLAERALPWLRSQLAWSDRVTTATTAQPVAARVRA